jgi:hypothetical protein
MHLFPYFFGVVEITMHPLLAQRAATYCRSGGTRALLLFFSAMCLIMNYRYQIL